jgi:hypothetical protein
MLTRAFPKVPSSTELIRFRTHIGSMSPTLVAFQSFEGTRKQHAMQE